MHVKLFKVMERRSHIPKTELCTRTKELITFLKKQRKKLKNTHKLYAEERKSASFMEIVGNTTSAIGLFASFFTPAGPVVAASYIGTGIAAYSASVGMLMSSDKDASYRTILKNVKKELGRYAKYVSDLPESEFGLVAADKMAILSVVLNVPALVLMTKKGAQLVAKSTLKYLRPAAKVTGIIGSLVSIGYSLNDYTENDIVLDQKCLLEATGKIGNIIDFLEVEAVMMEDMDGA